MPSKPSTTSRALKTDWINSKLIEVGKPIIILDWDFSGLYPVEFEENAFGHQFNFSGKFAKSLHQQLFGDEPSKNMRPLVIAVHRSPYISTGSLDFKSTGQNGIGHCITNIDKVPVMKQSKIERLK